jgi:hypothetical protein
MESKIHDIIQFWCGKDSYFNQEIPKGSLESLYNKWGALVLHPALRRTIAHKTSSFSLWDFMNSGGVVLVDLNEHRLKLEIRKTVAELLQYYFRLQVLKRHRLPPQDRKLFMYIADEFLQYRTVSTIDLVRIGRQFGVGGLFILQDLGLLPDEEFRALMQSGTLIAMNCTKQDAIDMSGELFVYSGQPAYRDWEETKTYTYQEQMQAWAGVLMQLAPGQLITRVKPSTEAYLIDTPPLDAPRSSQRKIEAFLRASAKLFYHTK